MKQTCKEIFEDAYRRAYMLLDGEGLTEAERLEIEAHLEDCAPCLERYGLEVEVSVVIARLRGAQACPDEVRRRIEALLEQA